MLNMQVLRDTHMHADLRPETTYLPRNVQILDIVYMNKGLPVSSESQNQLQYCSLEEWQLT